jgi:hypothetical protein
MVTPGSVPQVKNLRSLLMARTVPDWVCALCRLPGSANECQVSEVVGKDTDEDLSVGGGVCRLKTKVNAVMIIQYCQVPNNLGQ